MNATIAKLAPLAIDLAPDSPPDAKPIAFDQPEQPADERANAMQDRPRKWTNARFRIGRAGLSLVEVLVVLGIIAILAGMLLPMLMGARKSAQTTACLNNLRQIGIALTQYLNENHMTMPDAGATNCWDDPASPRGAKERELAGYIRPVGEVLDGYLKHDLRIWRCPAARTESSEPPGLMREPRVLKNGLRPGVDAVSSDFNPADGLWGENGQWRPGYMYVSTRGWTWYMVNQPLVWKYYWMEDWMARNVAGLKLERAKTVTKQPSTSIVVFLDYSSTYHSKSPEDVYAVEQPITEFDNASPSVIRRQPFRSNLLYLDGHCESKEYGWAGGLVNLLHKPVKQKWGDLDYEEAFPDGYTNTYPN